MYSTRGMVCSSQPLASAAGAKVLSKGGNCVEAAVAVSAALCVVEPMSTGIGGDCFALLYRRDTGTVEGINGSGRSAKKVEIKDVLNTEPEGVALDTVPQRSIFSVTVPGAICGWFDTLDKWGSKTVSLHDIFEPAITLAKHGFPVSDICANMWRRQEKKLADQNTGTSSIEGNLLFGGKGPLEGQFIKNTLLAGALELISEKGKEAFYAGPISEAIIRETKKRGHKLDAEDFTAHTSTFVDPICIRFLDFNVWEIPPNGQGLVALIALGVIRELHKKGVIDLYKIQHNSTEYFHLLIEACKIGFYDSENSISDLDYSGDSYATLLCESHLQERASLFKKNDVIDSNVFDKKIPDPKNKSDTVYHATTDSSGDSCSFINSVYEGFGSAIMVPEYGFCLQNRGANFNLVPGSTNCLEGFKRPYHTIIPSMITNAKDNSLFASFGNMGGYMQPVGHVQHVLNLCLFKFSAQHLTDLPRFCLKSDQNSPPRLRQGSDTPVSTSITTVALEEGVDESVFQDLSDLGHSVTKVSGYDRSLFGRAQIIRDESFNGNLIFAGGSDLRGDGSAMPVI